MNAPTKAKVRRNYRNAKGDKLPGVTTIIGDTLGWSKSALMAWSAKIAARAAVDMLLDGGAPDDVADRARKEHYRVRDNAADAGTIAHAYAEIYLRSGAALPEPDWFDDEDESHAKARKAFNRFRAWWDGEGSATYEVAEIELALTDMASGYGGTIDLVLRRKSDGALLVADLKTGKSIYDEVLIQLGAYRLLLGTHGRDVVGGLIVHAPVEGDEPCRVVTVSDEMLRVGSGSFGALLLVYRSKNALKINLDSQGGVP